MSEPNKPPTDAGPTTPGAPALVRQEVQPAQAGNVVLATTDPHTRFTDELNADGATFPPIEFAGSEVTPDQAKAAIAAAARSNIGLVRRDSRLAPATTVLVAPEGTVVADNRHGLSFPAVTNAGTEMTYEQANAARAEAARIGVELKVDNR